MTSKLQSFSIYLNFPFSEVKDDKKRARLPKKSTDRFEESNKIVKPNPIKDQKRKPPGILGKMPVKKVIKTSLSRDHKYINESPQSSESSFKDSSEKVTENAVKIYWILSDLLTKFSNLIFTI